MKRMLIAMAAVVTGLSGCASPARYVERSGDVGVIAIPANTDAWPTHYRREALAAIEKHVGPDYEIVEEKEVVVGTRTNNNQQVQREATVNSTVPFLPAQKDTINNTTSTQDITEYRIAYRKRYAPDSTLPGGPSPYGLPPNGASGVQPAGAVMPARPNTPVNSFMGDGCKQ